MEGTAKGPDVQNRWKDPEPVFWNLPSHEEQGEQEKQHGKVPLEMVSEVGGVHTCRRGEVRTVFLPGRGGSVSKGSAVSA